ncbi:MAG: HNH endonuclease [Phycisphaerae bacterium]|nr:HNH endonuclease [Phycisphaerae bacterium]
MPYAPKRHRSMPVIKRVGQRPSPSQRGYDRHWQRVRRWYLMKHPLCEDPFNDHDGRVVAGEVVDHIVPLARGGTHNESNLQTLCASCHSKKTVKYDGGFGNSPNDR